MTELATGNPRLIALTGPLRGRSFEFGSAGLSLGRHQKNAVAIPDLAVSRRHCRVVPAAEGGGWWVEDLESRDGTFVNGRPARSAPLAEGDLLLVGSSTFLVSSVPEPEAERPGAVSTEAETATRFAVEDSRYLRPRELRVALSPKDQTARALNALLGLAREVLAAREVEELCRVLLRETLSVAPVQRCAVLLADADGALELSATREAGEGGATIEDGFVPSANFVATVAAEGRGLAWSREPRGLDSAASTVDPGAATMVGVPMLARGRVLGVLYADSSEAAPGLGEDEIHLLAAAAGLAAGALDGALHRRRLERENRRLQEAELGHGLVGESPAVRRVYELISRAAPSDSTVLVLGESGTGKELAARALHAESHRAARPFVAINCATLSETLLESELFGHERGAFTGAVAKKEGKLEVAQGGTLFLDEVGELPPGLQARLLRVLQERTFERVGGTRPLAADVRIVAATNRDLPEAVRRGEFRDDLYYRLNVICVELPPLRERSVDVELLAVHFAALHGRRIRGRPLTLAPEARTALGAHRWPGNVRELANAIERAVVLGDGEVIRPEDLPESVLEGAPEAVATSYHDALNATKRRLILDAVGAAGGNVTRAAEALGLHPNHLHRLITNLGLREELAG